MFDSPSNKILISELLGINRIGSLSQKFVNNILMGDIDLVEAAKMFAVRLPFTRQSFLQSSLVYKFQQQAQEIFATGFNF